MADTAGSRHEGAAEAKAMGQVAEALLSPHPLALLNNSARRQGGRWRGARSGGGVHHVGGPWADRLPEASSLHPQPWELPSNPRHPASERTPLWCRAPAKRQYWKNTKVKKQEEPLWEKGRRLGASWKWWLFNCSGPPLALL